jgi:hypothetical protein
MNDNVEKPQLPKDRQPDAVPENPVPSPPSLWTYGILLVIAAVLVATAFRDRTDWPGLLINLASGIVGAVIVLVFVERRLRQSEIQRVRSVPSQLRFLFGFLVSPSERESYRYARVFQAQLREALKRKTLPRHVQLLLPKVSEGFLLVGRFGEGKTTCLQFVALRLVEEYLKSPTSKKLPILFPLLRWSPDLHLEDAILEHMNLYVKVSQRTFFRIMTHGEVVGIFDGYDELVDVQRQDFTDQFSELRSRYTLVPWSVSSRPLNPPPSLNLPVIPLPELTEQEIRKIRQRRPA